MKTAEAFRTSREIRASWRSEGVKPRRLSILSSFTLEPLTPYLIVEADGIRCPIEPWFGPSASFEELVLEADSALWRHAPDVIWIAMRVEDVDPLLPHEFRGKGAADSQARLQSILDRLLTMAESVRRRSDAPLMISNQCLSRNVTLNIFDASDPAGLSHQLTDFNRKLAQELALLADCHVFDYAGAVTEAGMRNWSDPRLLHYAGISPGPSAQRGFARSIVRTAAALVRPPAKCLVVDLDHTLWGGVLGDDGPEGIILGGGYPGNVFKELQRVLLDLRSRGFLLAIASMNDREIVLQTLAEHPEMVLREEHFAVICADWKPKAEKLRSIADELNIGLDSLVLIDDNPVERAQVRHELPMVEVIELPADPAGYLGALAESPALDRPRLSGEDRRRADEYCTERYRRRYREKAITYEEFLAGLEMTATVGRSGPHELIRVVQLIQKTNQFNLTARRHATEQVRRFMEADGSEVLSLRLSDRFSDMGIVCVGILTAVGARSWEIDTFLMSCRVMGRLVENAFLAFLLETAAGKGAATVRGIYRRTGKNHMVQDFYARSGFAASGDNAGSEQVYQQDLALPTQLWPGHIRRV